MEVFIFGWWWRSHQSLAHKGLRTFRFCVMPWNIFPGFTTLQLCNKVQEFLSNMSTEPEDFTGRVIFMWTFNDISLGSKDNEQECELSAQLVPMYAKRFSAGKWSFLGSGSEKKWYSTLECKPQGEWDWHLQKANTQSSDPQVHCPEERSQAKEVENYQYIFALTRERLKLFFA